MIWLMLIVIIVYDAHINFVGLFLENQFYKKISFHCEPVTSQAHRLTDLLFPNLAFLDFPSSYNNFFVFCPIC